MAANFLYWLVRSCLELDLSSTPAAQLWFYLIDVALVHNNRTADLKTISDGRTALFWFKPERIKVKPGLGTAQATTAASTCTATESTSTNGLQPSSLTRSGPSSCPSPHPASAPPPSRPSAECRPLPEVPVPLPTLALSATAAHSPTNHRAHRVRALPYLSPYQPLSPYLSPCLASDPEVRGPLSIPLSTPKSLSKSLSGLRPRETIAHIEFVPSPFQKCELSRAYPASLARLR